ncbi:hypothetical protein PFISCL1PPCAC_2686, partial [Pristionchus fissidentatus]
ENLKTTLQIRQMNIPRILLHMHDYADLELRKCIKSGNDYYLEKESADKRLDRLNDDYESEVDDECDGMCYPIRDYIQEEGDFPKSHSWWFSTHRWNRLNNIQRNNEYTLFDD